MNTRPLYIFDLDGTLALIEHRRHFVQLKDGSQVIVEDTIGTCRGPNPKIDGDFWVEWPDTGRYSYDPSDIKFKPNWDAFHAACVDDLPNTPVIETLHALRAAEIGYPDIWIFSGRSDAVREQTESWLAKHAGIDCYDDIRLLMRAAGDYTPDDVLKKSWYDAMSAEDKARLVATFDDRDRVVAMWRSLGVTCFQVAPGDF
jgi:FMN phosphatase YigB (HAD superfamily)